MGVIDLARRSTKRRRQSSGRNAAASSQRTVMFGAAAVLLVVLTAFLIPRLGAQGKLPEVGKPIADFTIQDVDGRPFTLSEAYRDNELILVFYRGYA